MQQVATTSLRRIGNSTGLIVPKLLLAALGAREGEQMDIAVEDGRLVAGPSGTLSERVSVSVEDLEELRLLADELNAAADRMERRLDAVHAKVRAALDPCKEEALRGRLQQEVAGKYDDLFEELAR